MADGAMADGAMADGAMTDGAKEREERLAAALRDNLRRRKQAARAVSDGRAAGPQSDQRVTTIEPSQ